MANTEDPQKPRTVTFTVPKLPRPVYRPRPINRIGQALLIILALVFSGFAGAWLESHHEQINTSSLSTQKKIVTSQSQLINEIAKQVGPSVVSINVDITTQSNLDNFFGFDQGQQQSQAAGTGIIISDKGLIVTNRHVVPAGATNVSVTLSDGTELKDVSVLGRTNDNDSLDVAFLKINDTKGHKLTPASIGDSSKVQVGDSVVAIGNALGQFQNSVTSGIISGFGRSVQAGDSSGSQSTENLTDLFQTDAAINQGNSGGPLVNLNGQVIGINTAIAGDGAQNIGFAIPIGNVKGLIDQVVDSGRFSRPYLGVRYVTLTSDIAGQYGLKVTKGAFIPPGSNPTAIITDSPADKAGLKDRDVITAVNGQSVDNEHSLTSRLSQHQPGDKIELTVQREDKKIELHATLGTLPDSQ